MEEDAPPAPEAPSSRGDVIRKTWMFCPVTGTLLILDAAQGVARSRYCEFARPLADLDDTMSVGEAHGRGRGALLVVVPQEKAVQGGQPGRQVGWAARTSCFGPRPLPQLACPPCMDALCCQREQRRPAAVISLVRAAWPPWL